MSEEQTTDDTRKGRREGGMVEPQAAEFKQKPKFHYAEKCVMLPKNRVILDLEYSLCLLLKVLHTRVCGSKCFMGGHD